MDRDLYPDNWEAISLAVREAAGWRCQGTPKYPDCRAASGSTGTVTGHPVVLTVAHMGRDPSNSNPANLRALCQRCHLDWDRKSSAAIVFLK